MSSRKKVFLLGAGFSKPAGYPLDSELFDAVAAKSVEIANAYGYCGMGDCKSITTVLGSPNSSQLLLPFLLRTVRKKYPDLRSFDRLVELSEMFASGLVRLNGLSSDEEASWALARREPHGLCASSVVNGVHDALMLVFSGIVPNKTAYVDSLVLYAHETGSSIYTTNFDLLIEESCARLRLSPVVPGTVSPVSVGLSSSGFKLYKLHGSLDWDPLPLIDHEMKDGYVVRYERGCSLRGSQNIDLDVRDKLGRVALMLPHLNSLVKDWASGVELVVIGNGLSDSHLAAVIVSRLHVSGHSIAVVNNSPELPSRLHCSYQQILKAIGSGRVIMRHSLGAEAYCLSQRHHLKPKAEESGCLGDFASSE